MNYSLEDFLKIIAPYLSTVFISVMGGSVHHIQKSRKSKKNINLKEWLMDCLIAGFAGLLTKYICDYGNVDPNLSSALIGISGHMGARAIMRLEKSYEDMLKVDK